MSKFFVMYCKCKNASFYKVVLYFQYLVSVSTDGACKLIITKYLSQSFEQIGQVDIDNNKCAGWKFQPRKQKVELKFVDRKNVIEAKGVSMISFCHSNSTN